MNKDEDTVLPYWKRVAVVIIVILAIFSIIFIYSIPNNNKQVGTAIVPSPGQSLEVSPELKYDERWQVLVVPRVPDGVMCVSVVDRISGEVKSFQCFASCRQ